MATATERLRLGRLVINAVSVLEGVTTRTCTCGDEDGWSELQDARNVVDALLNQLMAGFVEEAKEENS